MCIYIYKSLWKLKQKFIIYKTRESQRRACAKYKEKNKEKINKYCLEYFKEYRLKNLEEVRRKNKEAMRARRLKEKLKKQKEKEVEAENTQ